MQGKTFGKLTVVEEVEKSKGHMRWLCRCDCGNEIIVDGGNLRSGHSTSCGNCHKYVEHDDNSMECVLPNGQTFLFSKEDFHLVSQHKWSIENNGYVHTTINGSHVRLHQYLLARSDLKIDHINGLRNDNRRNNLRFVTDQQNSWNTKKPNHNTSGYKGVSFCKARNKYEVRIRAETKNKFLGYYDSPIEAALAYDRAAAFYFGEYARTNFGKEDLNERKEEILELGESGRAGRPCA